jgi:hypothetical protein
MEATYYGHAPVCSQFLAAGTAVNAKNARGLHYGVRRREREHQRTRLTRLTVSRYWRLRGVRFGTKGENYFLADGAAGGAFLNTPIGDRRSQL